MSLASSVGRTPHIFGRDVGLRVHEQCALVGSVLGLAFRRTISGLVAILTIVTAVFFAIRSMGIPIQLLAGDEPTEAQLQAALHQHGLDRPILEQYGDFLLGILQGDFGDSLRYGESALGLVLERMPATASLALLAITLAIIIAIPTGIYAALKPGSILDSVARIGGVIGQSIPSFWLGLLLVMVFSVRLNLLPSGGSGSWQHLVLPAIALGTYSVPIAMRLVRSSMLEVLSQDYIVMARAKGLGERTVVVRHALRNASLPVLTVIALQFGFMITGSIVLEEVFSYPGVGRLAIESMRLRDYPLMEAFTFVVAAMVISVNLIVDIAYGIIDPRIRVD